MEALLANNIVKQFTNHRALDRVNLTIPEGCIYGLLGPNGAGKTTLIRIINQIIQQDEGQIHIFGEPLNPSHIKLIGYLPEERGLYKKLKVGEQLVYLARLRGLSKEEATARSKAWVVKFEITDWWDKKVEDLSKGMAQKVQFISTVLHQPKLIILDEPFSGFDPVNAQLITKEILELKEQGSTIIFSTHRMETVEALCDYIALINKSRQILEGKQREIKNTYRNNTFIVTHSTPIHLPSERYQVLNTTSQEDTYETVVSLGSGIKPNLLLQDLISQTDVLGFTEKVPTMSEIFISLVKEDKPQLNLVTGGEHE